MYFKLVITFLHAIPLEQ